MQPVAPIQGATLLLKHIPRPQAALQVTIGTGLFLVALRAGTKWQDSRSQPFEMGTPLLSNLFRMGFTY